LVVERNAERTELAQRFEEVAELLRSVGRVAQRRMNV